jgi:hypothetical protein
VAKSQLLVPAYGIVAGRRMPTHRLLDDVLTDIDACLRRDLGSGTVEVSDYHVSGKDKALLPAVYAGVPIFIKLPFGAARVQEEMDNARLLGRAKADFARDLSYIPRHHGSGVVGGVTYFVEDRCDGVTLHHAMAQLTRSMALKLAEGALDDLNRHTVVSGEPLSGECYEQRVMRPLERLASVLDDGAIRPALERFFETRLHGVKLPRGIEHGDFGHDNILTDGRRVTGLIDWAGARVDGIPVLDALSFVEAAERVGAPTQRLADTIPRLARSVWHDAEERRFVERQYQRWNVDPVHHPALVALCWLQHVTALVSHGIAYDPARVEHDIVGVAQEFVEVM